MANDLYIGCPNGIVLCVDEINQMGCSGRFYHSYQEEAVSFESLGEMLFRMEAFFDSLNFPRRGNTARNFTEPHTVNAGWQKERERIMADREVLDHKGRQETFIVRVQHRQNNIHRGAAQAADDHHHQRFPVSPKVGDYLRNAKPGQGCPVFILCMFHHALTSPTVMD